MKSWLWPAVVLGLLVLLGLQCRTLGSRDAKNAAAAKAYADTTGLLRAQLALGLGKRDTLIQRVPVEVVRIVHAKARVDTVKAGFAQDTTTADSLHTALGVIAVQDTVIQQQGQHIKTLTEIVVTDSGVISLFQTQRKVDSLRIKRLETQQRGLRLFGLKLPSLKCTAGLSAVVYPKQAAGLGGTCGFTF